MNPEGETKRIVAFVSRAVRKTRSRGVVVGLSGGVDSAVVGALCVEALGPQRVLAVLLPSRHTPRADLEDAVALAKGWGVATVQVEITPIVGALLAAVGRDGGRLAEANLQARVRMTILYFLANSRSLLVAGTGDRSEILVGFFTKFGDGAADILPIAHLYKTQVRALATQLGVPPRIAQKPASPRLWRGHMAEQELPVGYERLDIILREVIDEGASPPSASVTAGVSDEVVRRVMEMVRASAHKRSLPPCLRPRR